MCAAINYGYVAPPVDSENYDVPVGPAVVEGFHWEIPCLSSDFEAVFAEKPETSHITKKDIFSHWMNNYGYHGH